MTDKVTLYIATHNKTGLKYFGKTIRYFTEQDLQMNCHGSGIYWNNHLKKHGDNVTMEIYGIFSLNEEDEDYVVPIALKFSEENNIVQDYDNWANQIPENGLGGNYYGNSNEVPNISCVNSEGEFMTLNCHDKRFLSGEFVSIHKGVSPHMNNRNAVSQSNTNMAVYKDSDGNIIRTSTSDSKVISGELVGIHKGRTLSEEHKDKLKGKIPYNAHNIKIFDGEGKLRYVCLGNFVKFCTDNELPLKALKKSYSNGGVGIYESSHGFKISPEKFKKYRYWYAEKFNQ